MSQISYTSSFSSFSVSSSPPSAGGGVVGVPFSPFSRTATLFFVSGAAAQLGLSAEWLPSCAPVPDTSSSSSSQLSLTFSVSRFSLRFSFRFSFFFAALLCAAAEAAAPGLGAVEVGGGAQPIMCPLGRAVASACC